LTDTTHTLEIGFRWERLAAPVEVRFKAGGAGAVEIARSQGRRLRPEERLDVLRFSFREVRRSIESKPGIYLIEAFRATGPLAVDGRSMPKEVWSDLAADVAELRADPGWEDERPERKPLWFYIGMSGDLKERFRKHEDGESALMRNLNAYLGGSDAWLRMSLQRAQSIRHGGRPETVDLASSLVRTLFENAAIADYRHRNPGAPMVNADGRLPADTEASLPLNMDDFETERIPDDEIPW
jgi:hypothetical protein